MSKSANTTTIVQALGVGIAIIQLLDIIIHAATNQLEIIRVTSNIVILLWLAFVASGKANIRFRGIAIRSISLYLILNIIFLESEGLTNAEQGGGVRVVLFLLMFLTLVLSAALTYIHNRSRNQ
jgi:hypothetical protein